MSGLPYRDALETLLAVLDDAGVSAALFEHCEKTGGKRVAQNAGWLALGGGALDELVLAGGFVEDARVLESELSGMPVEVRLQGARADGVSTTVAVIGGRPSNVRRVAHDLSNPLTYLLIHLRRLRDIVPRLVADGERAKIEQLLAEALEGGERMVSILRDTVAASRR